MTNETQTKKLEILVIEDTPIHQESARILLADHNVEVVGSYDDAMDRINGPSCYACRRQTSGKKHYDVVLTDMFLPQGRGDCTGNNQDPSTEQPFGYAIAQTACLNLTPYVGIVSDADHHANGIAFSMDPLNEKVMNVNGSRYCVFNNSRRLAGQSRVGVKTDGTFVAVPEKVLEQFYAQRKYKDASLKEYEGFALTFKDGANRIAMPNHRKSVNPEAKDWLSALIYLMTA